MKNIREKCIGLMSGTSLDGLDICCAEFRREDGKWVYEIRAVKAVKYPAEIEDILSSAFNSNKDQLKDADIFYGKYLGEQVNVFIRENGLSGQIRLIASHGHTVFHEPEKGITVQIGDGAEIAGITQIPVINDFRITDVKLGGQGAPLVPVGDEYLFGDYNACLNLGGIANVSFRKDNDRLAFDICPCNLPLNKFAAEFFNQKYDRNGELAQIGNINESLLKELDNLSFYHQKGPKSLAVEWLNEAFYPVLDHYKKMKPHDLLRTILEHETNQIARTLNENQLNNVFVTGGGAFNTFFVRNLKEKTISEVILPNTQLIEFKEALVFAFLGLLRIENEVNTFKSVTGASRDSVGGILHKPH